MYAIIRTGGKQYRVSEGDVLNVEKLNVEEGQEVVFDEVLTVVNDGDVKVGAPTVAGAKVTAKVAKQGKADKIFVFKYRAKSNYRKRQGHRQPFTQVEITSIEAWQNQTVQGIGACGVQPGRVRRSVLCCIAEYSGGRQWPQ